MTTYTIDVTDNDGTVGRATFPVNILSTGPQLTALYDAVNALQRGTQGDGILHSRSLKDAGSYVKAADPNARKGQGFKVRWQENEHGLFRSTVIPCADTTLIPGVDELDIGAGVGATLKAALEVVGQDEKTLGTLTVVSIDFVD